MLNKDKGQLKIGRERALSLLKVWEDELKIKNEICDGNLKSEEKNDSKIPQGKTK